MKKIKSYITNLPKGVKIILLINLFVYLLSIILDFLFSYDLVEFLSIKATNDDRFHLYQFLTNIFTHDLFFVHIVSNLLFFIVFAPNVENIIKTKNFITLYFVSGIVASIVCNFGLIQKYNDLIFTYKSYKPIDYYDGMTNEMNFKDGMRYNISYGASGSIFGIMSMYLILNILTLRKIFYNLVVIFFIFLTIRLIYIDKEGLLTYLNHFGGIIGGTLIGIIYLLFSWYKKKWSKNIYPINNI